MSTLDGGGNSWPPPELGRLRFHTLLLFHQRFWSAAHFSITNFSNRDAFDLKFLILSTNSLMVKMN